MDSSGTLVDVEQSSRTPTCFTMPPPTNTTTTGALAGDTGRGIGGACQLSLTSGRVGGGARSRGVPVAPLQLEGEKPMAKAFANTKVSNNISLQRSILCT